MQRVTAPFRHPGRLAWLLMGTLVLSSVLAGCVGPGLGGDGPGDSDSVLTFGDGSGVGATDPLIPLTDDAHADAAAIVDACEERSDLVPCAVEYLKAVLSAVGSGYAFDVLDAMSSQHPTIQRQDHPMAHYLGAHALHTYGTIGETLATCSMKVFQGCYHGALEEYFRYIDELNAETVANICPTTGTQFDRYACEHGLGHGLVLGTDYDLAAALDLCATLSGSSRGNCYGGAFMENVVAYMGHQRGEGHMQHEHVMFWVDPDNLHYPCDVVDTAYRHTCWLMQTSLILYLNRADFQEVSEICSGLSDELQRPCFRSMGRDASAYSVREPHPVALKCDLAPTDQTREWCIHGFVSDVISHYADPAAALPTCHDIPERHKAPCYEGLGSQGRTMVDDERMSVLCGQAEEGYEADCRRGARLD